MKQKRENIHKIAKKIHCGEKLYENWIATITNSWKADYKILRSSMPGKKPTKMQDQT